MSFFDFLRKSHGEDNSSLKKESEDIRNIEYTKDQLTAFKDLDRSINTLLNVITPNLGLHGLVNGLSLLQERIEAAFSHEEGLVFDEKCNFIIMKEYYLKPDTEKMKALTAVILAYKMKMPTFSNQSNNLEGNTVKLKCPKCNIESVMANESVYQQWRLLEGGSSISGGVVIHCHSCAFSASISEWFNAK